ncbi:hypothetical protein DOTSEDRAFT_21351 [Dothistroma septosporum NZE10]|uniref:Uncharacterized protein n=1 Tax=Dothistroma septosporum (strain NZE10 / CBS 128990) TaxID=675120 RepID=N1PZD6_DOTSN|nr:hypothetical protein DOTSEDRAFT_21351 [Dothistroma septosporum NZE10]
MALKGSHHHESARLSKHTTNYKDLTKADYVKLTLVVAPIPPPDTIAGACYNEEIKKLIANLPPHLRAKYPLITSSCSCHRKINDMPLSSILDVIQDEVSLNALEQWAEMGNDIFVDSVPVALLEDINAIWLKPEHFQQTFGRNPSPNCIWSFVDTKCVVCKLAHIARSGPAVTALGALIIARLRPENWKKSKRMYFFEEWLKSCVEFSYKQEPAILAMWECGTRLRAAREARKSIGEYGPRKYIDKFIAQVRSSTDGSCRTPGAGSSSGPRQIHAAPTSRPVAGPSHTIAQIDNPRTRPVRPLRSLRQEDHLKFTNAMLQQTLDDWTQTPISVSSTAPLMQPLWSPAQQDYAHFSKTFSFPNDYSQPDQEDMAPPATPEHSNAVRMAAVRREFYREAHAVSQEYNIRNPLDDEAVHETFQRFSRTSARPQGLSVKEPRNSMPISSSIYSRPQTGASCDEEAVIEMYRNGGCAGLSSGL